MPEQKHITYHYVVPTIRETKIVYYSFDIVPSNCTSSKVDFMFGGIPNNE